ncbi:MAG: SH3 domain-containing protein [Bacteroidales bacterium]|nr:SH3 domain-containing protein [Bacteroidales bacterium]
MNRILIILLFSTLFFSCKNSGTNSNTTQTDSNQTTNNQQNQTDNNTEYISIIGNQIWVRSEPQNGDVILKLDDGVQCELLEKGQQQTINGVTDYWYKIKVNGQEGWVFGSQTSLQQNTNVDEQTLITNYFNNFFDKVNAQNYSELKSYFIDDSVIVLYNPGVFVYYSFYYYTEALELLDVSEYGSEINFSAFPTFDMDEFAWSKNGLYVQPSNNAEVITHLNQFSDYPQYIIDKVSKSEKMITHTLLAAYHDGVYFYFGKVNSQWKIIAIDISTNDA